MFDIGFSELVLVGIVALIVIGPKDLPRVARMAGLWLGRARRALASVKEEIDREMKSDELKQILEKQRQSNPVETILEPSRSTGASAGATHAGSAGAAPEARAEPRKSGDK